MARRLGIALATALVMGWGLGTPVGAMSLFVLPNGSMLYNTGVNDSGDPLPFGTVDPHYAMSINPSVADPLDPNFANARFQGAAYLSANDANSGWVSPTGTGNHAPPGLYQIDTTIDLTGLPAQDLAGIEFQGFWLSDNQGVDILVNGASTGQTNTGAHQQLPSASSLNAFTLTAAHGLLAGLNTIAFQWGNGPAYGGINTFPDPTHVRVEFTGFSITPIPLPAALGPFALAGAWLLRRRTRR